MILNADRPKSSANIPCVGIIGCGWLGQALAIKLKLAGHQVLATATKDESLQKLNQLGIQAQKLSLPVDDKILKQHDIFTVSSLIICIPPRLKQNPNESSNNGQAVNNYPLKIEQLVQAAKVSKVKQIIMISTTAIYNGLFGRISEQTPLNFSAKKVKTLFLAEQAALKFKGKVDIVRLAGLVGPERHPGRFLSADRMMKNPQAHTNLIHQIDAVGIIYALLQPQVSDSAQSIYNGVSKVHNTRELFYQTAASSIGLPPPQFEEQAYEKNQNNKLILPSKEISGQPALQTLGYRFIYPDLMTWLKEC